MMTTMRSNDIYLGFPYDVFVFTMIQRYVAGAIDMEVGPYHHHVGSMHLYDTNSEAARGYVGARSEVIDTTDLTVPYPWPTQVLENSEFVMSPNHSSNSLGLRP